CPVSLLLSEYASGPPISTGFLKTSTTASSAGRAISKRHRGCGVARASTCLRANSSDVQTAVSLRSVNRTNSSTKNNMISSAPSKCVPSPSSSNTWFASSSTAGSDMAAENDQSNSEGGPQNLPLGL